MRRGLLSVAVDGLATEAAPHHTRRTGRRSQVVRPESRRAYACAVSIEVDRIRAARVARGGEILDRAEVPRRRGEPGAARVVAPLGELLRRLQHAAPSDDLCVGTGVAVCALDRRDETLALGEALPDRQPLAVGSIADLATLAEHARGAAAGCDNVIYLYGDVGVSAGIIADGRRVAGHGGYVMPDPATVPLVGDWLGFGVANLINIFNPEMVIFGGTLRDVYLAATVQVRHRLDTMCLPVCREHVRLRTPMLGEDAALLGAAELAFEQLVADRLGD